MRVYRDAQTTGGCERRSIYTQDQLLYTVEHNSWQTTSPKHNPPPSRSGRWTNMSTPHDQAKQGWTVDKKKCPPPTPHSQPPPPSASKQPPAEQPLRQPPEQARPSDRYDATKTEF